MSQTHDRTIGFFLANNATPEQVNACIDDIRRFYGVVSAPGVAPAVAAVQNTTAAAAPAVVTDNGGVELDSTGLPYDERIHSGSRSKTNKGVWTKRKGVDDATFNRVSAELRATMGASAAPVATATPTLPAAPAAAAVPNLPTLPQGGPVVPALPSVAPSPYQQFVAWQATLLHSPTNPTGRLTADWINQLIEAHGVPGGLANLAHREDLIPAIEAAIKGALG
ncbi:RecT-like ssDNA annealing protein [Stenotrophomonas phage Silvanus]|nr:RecT-like ssDNA annealing protein [Stenotrophomonas phage Silvanus]